MQKRGKRAGRLNARIKAAKPVFLISSLVFHIMGHAVSLYVYMHMHGGRVKM